MDWDNDGRHDLLIGDSHGNVQVHLNRNSNNAPVLTSAVQIHSNGKPVTVGERAAPVADDWNGDGKKDLIIGNMEGNIIIFINEGQEEDPVFGTPHVLMIKEAPFNAGTRSAPRIIDWNGDGLNDLLVGGMEGYVYYLKNEGSLKEPAFNKAEKLYLKNGDALRYPDPSGAPRSRVYATDWNNDGLKDILVGGRDGKIMLYIADREPSYSPAAFMKRTLNQSKDSLVSLKNRLKETLKNLKRRYLSG